MREKFQRFGAAMFTPVLFFSFFGILLGISIVCLSTDMVGTIASEGTFWWKIWTIINKVSWTPFNNLPLLFVIGVPIGLAKKAPARAVMEAVIIYLVFNNYIAGMLDVSGATFGIDYSLSVGVDYTTGVSSGLANIMGIKSLDTGMIGAILVSGIAVWLHEKFYEKRLPEFLGIFQGSVFVVMIGVILLLPLALITCFVWPKIQSGMVLLQGFLTSTGTLGVFIYTFLERLLIPTGLHHFIYGPFLFGPAVVPEGIAAWWPTHLAELANAISMKEYFPGGGFSLHGLSKVFGSTGIALAIYATAKPEKKKAVAALLIPATLTAVLVGTTEPLEFTFLFVSPALFAIHAVLAGSLSAISYHFGIVGGFGGGLIDSWIPGCYLPLFKYHPDIYIKQIVIGLIFVGIYFLVFRYLIVKWNVATPGREMNDEGPKLFTKKEYKERKEKGLVESDVSKSKALLVLEALGGADNIKDVTNCATRLRVTVEDTEKLASDSVFKEIGAHGIVHNGKAIQVIIGLSVPILRSEFEDLLEQLRTSNNLI